MRVHYLQHVAFEEPGYIETWLHENGHTVSATRFFETRYTLPDINSIDALIVLGGPMGVYDDHEYRWLQDEKIFIEDCINAGKKVLGICLGAQLIAVCLGAHVYTANNKEIGWLNVSPTGDCKEINWLYALFEDEPVVFHWHGDKFEIPYNGSFSFLTSEANTNQAFYYNGDVIALQFHLEVTEKTIEAMLNNCGHELNNAPYVQTETDLRSGFIHIARCNKIMASVLEQWLVN